MRLFIGTKNPGKIEDWRGYLPEAEIISYLDLGIEPVQVEEGFGSLRDNAERKALAWAGASGETTLSDDTGFFIKALGGLPGVSVKRWGGRFEEEMSDAELAAFMEKELEKVEDTSSYFETVCAIARPSGVVASFAVRYPGFIDKSLFGTSFAEGFAIGSVFKADGRRTVWHDMNMDEKRVADREMIEKIREMLRTLAKEPGRE